MTLGKASPKTPSSLCQRMPFGAGVRRATEVTKTASSSGKCVNTWRTRPGTRRHLAPFRRGADRKRTALVEVVRPVAARHFRHRGEQALVGTLAQKDRAIGAQRDEGSTAPQFAFALGRLAREGLLVAARVGGTLAVPRAQRAGRPLGRAQRRAQIHQRLREIAGPLRRQQRGRQPLDLGFCRRQVAASTANSRATTRSTLPSTGTAGASYAIAATAAAV